MELTEAQLNAAPSSAFDRVVIVHNNDEALKQIIGCGVLKGNPTNNYPNTGYELGDLSGRNGNPTVTNGVCSFRVIDNCDFTPIGLLPLSITGKGIHFTSIVFHRASNGDKYFAAKLTRIH